jgi:hypothetical protein
VIYGDLRIDIADRGNSGVRDRRRIGCGAQHQLVRGSRMLSGSGINFVYYGAVQAEFLRIAHDADDGSPSPSTIEGDPLVDRILIWPAVPSQALVHHQHAGRVDVVALREIPPGNERLADGGKITGSGVVDQDRRSKLSFRRRPALDLKFVDSRPERIAARSNGTMNVRAAASTPPSVCIFARSRSVIEAVVFRS